MLFPVRWILPLSQLLFITATSANGPIVSLDYGTFLGVKDRNLTKFLGVPYSEPTSAFILCFIHLPRPDSSSARFELPRLPVPLPSIQNATVFGPPCPAQMLSDTTPINFTNPITIVSEACLLLDVFSPALDSHSKFPVLVFIIDSPDGKLLSSGGFEAGSSAETDVRPTVEHSILLGEPVVVVVPNYRVSAFGFLAGKEVADAGITNLGLRDQIFALEWVQQHISAFGGDPDRVVLGGLSAGAFSTGLLLLSNNQNSSGLFRGAFMVSVSVVPTPPLVCEHPQVSGSPLPSPTVADGQPSYDELVEANNCTTARNTLDCLARVPLDAFMAIVNKTPDVFSYRSLSLVWRPRVDGDVIVRNPIESVAQGAFAKGDHNATSQVPIMSGDCDDEGTCVQMLVHKDKKLTAPQVVFLLEHERYVDVLNQVSRTDAEFLDYLQSNFLPAGTPAQVAQIAALYPQDPAQSFGFPALPLLHQDVFDAPNRPKHLRAGERKHRGLKYTPKATTLPPTSVSAVWVTGWQNHVEQLFQSQEIFYTKNWLTAVPPRGPVALAEVHHVPERTPAVFLELLREWMKGMNTISPRHIR
ncbi:Alpha/Beta hydrolase protein [Mycena maculata]|uniref:Carboxylic ester hydrolase n=1 Tax=Mycena maculata TaxID=230809 RepID=A0AAD7I0B3_9AGAR|nr:Alpha/Beta hydrolase protein [Mycena maculata]